jgi:Mrp family chromosome partitioning ATPase
LQSPTIANLRSQYAEARKRYAELAGELGPLHPSLRQMEKQVEDLRRTINEEVDRYATSANNDLTRARDYEASLNKALDVQKDQSVQMSQAAVRLRELERDVEASRDVYQAFLKRSRETEEQESLNTSSARIIGEATVPQRRSFPPAMSLLAMVGFMFGALAAAAWAVIAGQLSAETESSPAQSATKPLASSPKPPSEKPPSAPSPRPQVAPASIEKPLIARLQESDVVRTLGGILASGGIPDVTRMGWPTLRAGFPLTTFLNTMRDVRAPLAQRPPANATPVMAVIGTGPAKDRSIAALNIALAAARDGAKVLLIDADHAAHALSSKLNRPGTNEASRTNWLSVGTKASRTIETTNGISVLPAITASDVKSSEAVQKAIAQARAAGGYDLVILDGPAMPWSAADGKLFDVAAGLVAILPASLDINDSMEKIITALGGAQRRLVGVVVNELQPATVERQRDKQYA